jgi:hypothetical protein
MVFDREGIGARRVHAASTATAKAFKRLVGRGLASPVRDGGIKLTGEGVGVAATLFQKLAPCQWSNYTTSRIPG